MYKTLIIFLVSFSIVCRGIDWRTNGGKTFKYAKGFAHERGLAAYSNLVTTKAPYWTTIITEKGFIKKEITIELLYQ